MAHDKKKRPQNQDYTVSRKQHNTYISLRSSSNGSARILVRLSPAAEPLLEERGIAYSISIWSCRRATQRLTRGEPKHSTGVYFKGFRPGLVSFFRTVVLATSVAYLRQGLSKARHWGRESYYALRCIYRLVVMTACLLLITLSSSH